MLNYTNFNSQPLFQRSKNIYNNKLNFSSNFSTKPLYFRESKKMYCIAEAN